MKLLISFSIPCFLCVRPWYASQHVFSVTLNLFSSYRAEDTLFWNVYCLQFLMCIIFIAPEVLTAVTMKRTTFQAVMPCSLGRNLPTFQRNMASIIRSKACFLHQLTLWPWRWRMYFPTNQYSSPTPHNRTSRKMVLCICCHYKCWYITLWAFLA
jgi:hypothetical protein